MFTILVLAYNAEDTITDTLDSIYRQSYEKPFNMVVADDASTDATSTIAKAWIEKNSTRFSSATVSTNQHNLGTSKQINARMEELDTEISVGELINTVEYDYPTFHLSMDCFWCEVVKGDLVLKEHEAAKWVTKEQLNSVAWLPADIKLVENISTKL